MRYILASLTLLIIGLLVGSSPGASSDPQPLVASAISLESSAPTTVAPASASSPGHIDETVVGRFPAGYPGRPVTDKIIFTADNTAGILIRVSGAELLDKWRWRYFRPGNVLTTNCYFQIVPLALSTTPPAVSL